VTYDPIFKRTELAPEPFNGPSSELPEEMLQLLGLVDGTRTQTQIARLMHATHNYARELNELQARGLITAVGHTEFE
jgi:hypothetical protein